MSRAASLALLSVTSLFIQGRFIEGILVARHCTSAGLVSTRILKTPLPSLLELTSSPVTLNLSTHWGVNFY